MNAPAPSPTYLGPPKFHGPAFNKPIDRIVIHATVSRCRPGAARALAAYFRRTFRKASAHYAVDPFFTCQILFDSFIGYHAPPNSHSLGVELCDMQDERRPRRWRGRWHRMMLRRAARLVAALCDSYGVPPRKIDANGLRHGERGICGHVDVSLAFHQTTHVDPGPNFPWETFMPLVVTAYEKRRNRK